MTRGAAAVIAAVLMLNTLLPAVRAFAQAAEPFPEVPLPRRAARPHRWAYLAIAGGSGLIASSFAFERRADHAYDRYLLATDPGRISREYDHARFNDNLSTAALLGGEVLIGLGLYLRFLRHPSQDRVSFEWRPDRCAVALRF